MASPLFSEPFLEYFEDVTFLTAIEDVTQFPSIDPRYCPTRNPSIGITQLVIGGSSSRFTRAGIQALLTPWTAGLTALEISDLSGRDDLPTGRYSCLSGLEAAIWATSISIEASALVLGTTIANAVRLFRANQAEVHQQSEADVILSCLPFRLRSLQLTGMGISSAAMSYFIHSLEHLSQSLELVGMAASTELIHTRALPLTKSDYIPCQRLQTSDLFPSFLSSNSLTRLQAGEKVPESISSDIFLSLPFKIIRINDNLIGNRGTLDPARIIALCPQLEVFDMSWCGVGKKDPGLGCVRKGRKKTPLLQSSSVSTHLCDTDSIRAADDDIQKRNMEPVTAHSVLSKLLTSLSSSAGRGSLRVLKLAGNRIGSTCLGKSPSHVPSGTRRVSALHNEYPLATTMSSSFTTTSAPERSGTLPPTFNDLATTEPLSALCALLRNAPNLTTLDVSATGLHEEDAARIFDCLPDCLSLQHLNIDSNLLSTTGGGPVSAHTASLFANRRTTATESNSNPPNKNILTPSGAKDRGCCLRCYIAASNLPSTASERRTQLGVIKGIPPNITLSKSAAMIALFASLFTQHSLSSLNERDEDNIFGFLQAPRNVTPRLVVRRGTRLASLSMNNCGIGTNDLVELFAFLSLQDNSGSPKEVEEETGDHDNDIRKHPFGTGIIGESVNAAGGRGQGARCIQAAVSSSLFANLKTPFHQKTQNGFSFLQALSVSDNGGGNRCASMLARLLSRNTTLRALKVEGNSINHPESTTEIIAQLEYNKTLLQFRCSGEPPPPPTSSGVNLSSHHPQVDFFDVQIELIMKRNAELLAKSRGTWYVKRWQTSDTFSTTTESVQKAKKNDTSTGM